MTGLDPWRSLGTQGGHIEIAEYNSAWPRAFQREAELVLKACQPRIIYVHHIGSTAVPGLAAKPVLDILPVALSPVECSKAVPDMAKLGYRCRGENGIDGRFYFDKIVDGRTVVHAHMFPVDHPDVRRHLVFRDYLRSHPDVARDYKNLKCRLAVKNRDDRQAYTEAKAEFIGGVIEAVGKGMVSDP